MKDHLIKATAEGVRVFAAVTTDLVAEAKQRHGCSPTATAALGRTLTGSLLLAANLKNRECITVKVEGDGALGRIVADASPEGYVRGYVDHPEVDLPLVDGKLAVGAAVGEGMVSVTRFTGLKQPFTGSARLVSGEIAEDLTQYLYVSEQTPSSIGLGVLIDKDLSVKAAGGFFIQALPDVADETLDLLEKNMGSLSSVSEMIQGGCDAKMMVEKIFAGMDVNYFETTDLKFKCHCSKEKIQGVLVSLGTDDLSSLAEEGEAEVCCHFCAEKYSFTKEELNVLLEEVKGSVKQEIEIRQITTNKKQFIDLLLLADEQEDMVDLYLDKGTMFTLYDQGELQSICVVTAETDEICELKNIATYAQAQGKGYGRILIEHICALYGRQYKTLLVGTGDSPLTVPFYEKCGFSYSHKVKDFFVNNYDHPIYEAGIQLVDMVYLKKDLQ